MSARLAFDVSVGVLSTSTHTNALKRPTASPSFGRMVCAFLIQPYIERERDQSIWGNGKRIGARLSGMAHGARARCACKVRSHDALLLPLLYTRVILGRIGSSTCLVDILRDTRALARLASRVIYSKVHAAASFLLLLCGHAWLSSSYRVLCAM